MNICIHHGELRNESMDEEEEDLAQPDAENTIIDKIMEMCQFNVLAIQILEKDITEIKKNTLKNNDTHCNN